MNGVWIVVKGEAGRGYRIVEVYAGDRRSRALRRGRDEAAALSRRGSLIGRRVDLANGDAQWSGSDDFVAVEFHRVKGGE